MPIADFLKKHDPRKSIYNHTAASDLFAPVGYDEKNKFFLCKDNYVGISLISNPLTGADEGTAEKINALLNQNFPKDTLLQVSLYAGQDIEPRIFEIQNSRQKAIFDNAKIIDSGSKENWG